MLPSPDWILLQECGFAQALPRYLPDAQVIFLPSKSTPRKVHNHADKFCHINKSKLEQRGTNSSRPERDGGDPRLRGSRKIDRSRTANSRHAARLRGESDV